MTESRWQEKKLKDICTIKGGKRLPAGHHLRDHPTPYPYIKSRDIRGGKVSSAELQYLDVSTHERIKRYTVKAGDVCITIVANIGDVGVVPHELDGANLTENAVKLTDICDEIDPLFLGILLSHPEYKGYMEQLSAGAAQSKLGIYKIRQIKVRVPPRTTQRKISAILTAYEDLIETNKRRLTLLEKMAEEIYREWFVRKRFPHHRTTRFVKGVPAGWRYEKMGDLIEHYIGGGWGNEEQTMEFRDPAFVIRGTDIPRVQQGDIFSLPHRFHTISNLKSRAMQGDDFVFESSGGSKNQLLGRNVRVSNLLLHSAHETVIPASFCKLIRFNKRKVSPLLMEQYLRLFYEQGLVGIFQVQSTGISNYQFESFLKYHKVLIPPATVQAEFESHVRPLCDLKDQLGLQISAATRARNLLLPRLISGKLSVEDLDIQFPPSMEGAA